MTSLGKWFLCDTSWWVTKPLKCFIISINGNVSRSKQWIPFHVTGSCRNLNIFVFPLMPSVCLDLCTNRPFYAFWGQHLHPILSQGHGGVPEGRSSGEPRWRGRVFRLVLGHGLAVLQFGSGHWAAANAGCQDNPAEGTLRHWCVHRHGLDACTIIMYRTDSVYLFGGQGIVVLLAIKNSLKGIFKGQVNVCFFNADMHLAR